MRQILLFGTSGNPPTGRDGHSGIIDYFVTLGVCVSPDDFRCCWCLNQRPASDQARAPELAVCAAVVAVAGGGALLTQ